MMTVLLPTGRSINLHWVHSSHNFVTRADAGSTRRGIDDVARAVGRRLTACEISEEVVPDSYTLLAQGVSVVHPNDTFRKDVGRKLSLTKALSATDFNREEREAVWSAFHQEFGYGK
jgi:hypothetical protein